MNRIPHDIELTRFSNIVFFTGAGLSAESNIPTYRGQGGIWEKYNYEEFACQQAFDSNPEKVWDFHDERRAYVARCEPNAGHRVIADVERHKPGTTVITQNIDGLHQRAGSRNVIELHGSLWRVRCQQEGFTVENFDLPIQRRCRCGAYYRPDIVWFGDALNHDRIFEAIQAIQTCDILVTIGTSGFVYPAAQLPFYALRRGIPSVEINIEPTPMSDVYRHVLQGSASDMLRLLWPESTR